MVDYSSLNSGGELHDNWKSDQDLQHSCFLVLLVPLIDQIYIDDRKKQGVLSAPRYAIRSFLSATLLTT